MNTQADFNKCLDGNDDNDHGDDDDGVGSSDDY